MGSMGRMWPSRNAPHPTFTLRNLVAQGQTAGRKVKKFENAGIRPLEMGVPISESLINGARLSSFIILERDSQGLRICARLGREVKRNPTPNALKGIEMDITEWKQT